MGITETAGQVAESIATEHLLNKYLDKILNSNDPEDKAVLTRVITKLFGDKETREIYDNLAGNFDPLKDVDKYTYMPMKRKAKKSGEPETSQELLERTNNKINLQNILGDIVTGAGLVANAKNQTLSRVFQNNAATRSNREREVYGGNTADKVAAIAAPVASGLGSAEQALTGLIANRIYGNAALRRQAEMQAVMDAYNRNVGGTGLFFDARRKAGEGTLMPSNAK